MPFQMTPQSNIRLGIEVHVINVVNSSSRKKLAFKKNEQVEEVAIAVLRHTHHIPYYSY